MSVQRVLWIQVACGRKGGLSVCPFFFFFFLFFLLFLYFPAQGEGYRTGFRRRRGDLEPREWQAGSSSYRGRGVQKGNSLPRKRTLCVLRAGFCSIFLIIFFPVSVARRTARGGGNGEGQQPADERGRREPVCSSFFRSLPRRPVRCGLPEEEKEEAEDMPMIHTHTKVPTLGEQEKGRDRAKG